MPKAASATLPHFAPPSGPHNAALRLLTDPPAAPARQSDQAIEGGRREALAEAQAEFDRLRAADRVDQTRALADQEQRHNEKTARAIASRLGEAIAAIEASLNAAVARALAVFLGSAVRERALAELTETVRALVARKGGVSLRVVGPPGLIAALEPRLALLGQSFAVTLEEGAPDVTVALNETFIRTAIGEWASRLAAGAEPG